MAICAMCAMCVCVIVAVPACTMHYPQAANRLHVDENGNEVVDVPAPGEDAGKAAPGKSEAQPRTFSERKAHAKDDLEASVKAWTGWAIWLLVLASVGTLILSFVVPWASRRSAAYGLGAAMAVSLARYFLVTYGALAVDVVVWICIGALVIVTAAVGIPLAVAWMKRHAWQQGHELAAEPGKAREATALLALGSDKINAARRMVSVAIGHVQSGSEISKTSRNWLATLGIKLPEVAPASVPAASDANSVEATNRAAAERATTLPASGPTAAA